MEDLEKEEENEYDEDEEIVEEDEELVDAGKEEEENVGEREEEAGGRNRDLKEDQVEEKRTMHTYIHIKLKGTFIFLTVCLHYCHLFSHIRK